MENNEELKGRDLVQEESAKSTLDLLNDIVACNFTCVAGDLKNHGGFLALVKRFTNDENTDENIDAPAEPDADTNAIHDANAKFEEYCDEG